MNNENGKDILAISLLIVVVLAVVLGSIAYGEHTDVLRLKSLLAQTESDKNYCFEEWGNCGALKREYKHDLDFYKNAIEEVPVHCSSGLYQVTIDGLRAKVNYLEGQLNSCTDAYTRDFWGEAVSCSWDMCGCALLHTPARRDLCDDIGITPYYVAWTLCANDLNCSSCLEMTDGNVDHCFRYAYYR